jgi:plastocyanin
MQPADHHCATPRIPAIDARVPDLQWPTARKQQGSKRVNRATRFCCAAAMIAMLSPVHDAAAQTATPITVTLSNYAFTPSELDLKSGTTYRMHLVNAGTKTHSFSAPEFFAASQIAGEDQAKVVKGLVDLENGQFVDITVTAGRPGTFSFECTHFMHKMMGMHGTIVVQ